MRTGFYLEFQSDLESEKSRLDLAYPLLDSVILWQGGADGLPMKKVVSGDLEPFSTRFLDYWALNTGFQFEKVRVSGCFLRVETESSLQLPA